MEEVLEQQLRQLVVDHFWKCLKFLETQNLQGREKLHIIWHLLAKMYIYILVIYHISFAFCQLFFKNNRDFLLNNGVDKCRIIT